MMELFVILASQRAPTVAAWQRALQARGLPLCFRKEVNLDKARVLLPVRIEDREFELCFARDEFAQLEAAHPRLARLRIREPTVYTLGYGRNLWESAAAFYLAAALVAAFDAKAFEPQLGGYMALQDLLQAAEGCVVLALAPADSARVLQ